MTRENRKNRALLERTARNEDQALRESRAAKDRELDLCERTAALTRRDRDEWKARAEAAEADTRKAMDVLEYYGSLGACACTKDCVCGHCKARKSHQELIDAAISAQEPPK